MENNEKILLLLKHFQDTLHDVKTPINIILLLQQSLQNSPNFTREQMDYVCKIRENCEKVLNLISELNDTDKIMFGRFRTRFMNYDVINVIEESVQAAASLAQRKNISIVFDTDVEEKIAAIDKTLVERIMLNLMSNAIKYTPTDGLIEVNISDRGEHILIEVSDNGPGFPNGAADSIFDRFETDQSIENREGTGIGLSIVKEMVTLLNGTIEACNGSNGGARVSITLPDGLVILGSPEISQTTLC